jgi:hypothetical protein
VLYVYVVPEYRDEMSWQLETIISRYFTQETEEEEQKANKEKDAEYINLE